MKKSNKSRSLRVLRILISARPVISDTGLMELSTIPGLAHLRVMSTNLSDAGKKAFKQRNPKCELGGPPWQYAIKR